MKTCINKESIPVPKAFLRQTLADNFICANKKKTFIAANETEAGFYNMI